MVGLRLPGIGRAVFPNPPGEMRDGECSKLVYCQVVKGNFSVVVGGLG